MEDALMPIPQKRMDRAVAQWRDGSEQLGPGLAMQRAASDYAIPQRQFRAELQRRKAEKRAEQERQRARAIKRGGMYWD